MRYRLNPPKGLFFYPKDLRKLTGCSAHEWNRAIALSGVKLFGRFPLTDHQAFKILQRIRQVQGELYLKSLNSQSRTTDQWNNNNGR